jgi:PAS domain S-box-containing protein
MEKVLAALSTATDGAFSLDQRQRIVFWNAAAERLLGYGTAEVKGQACYDVFRGAPYPGCLVCAPDCATMCAAKRGEAIPSYNLLSQTKHGRPILLNVSVIVLPRTASPLVTMHLFRDVTPQMQYEAYVELVLRAAMQLPPPQTTLGWEVLGDSPLLAPLTAREKAVVYCLKDARKLYRSVSLLKKQWLTSTIKL